MNLLCDYKLKKDVLGNCLSTTIRTNGAVAIFLPGVAERIGQLMGGGFYMVFTSIHEVMIHNEKSADPEELKKVMEQVTFISMDIKLPGTTGREHWQEHRSMLELARQKDHYVKHVVTNDTTEMEFQRAVGLVEAADPEILFIIQPVTPYHGCAAAAPEKILACQAEALQHLRNVRVIPQTHKMIGQL